MYTRDRHSSALEPQHYRHFTESIIKVTMRTISQFDIHNLQLHLYLVRSSFSFHISLPFPFTSYSRRDSNSDLENESWIDDTRYPKKSTFTRLRSAPFLSRTTTNMTIINIFACLGAQRASTSTHSYRNIGGQLKSVR